MIPVKINSEYVSFNELSAMLKEKVIKICHKVELLKPYLDDLNTLDITLVNYSPLVEYVTLVEEQNYDGATGDYESDQLLHEESINLQFLYHFSNEYGAGNHFLATRENKSEKGYAFLVNEHEDGVFLFIYEI